MKTLNLLVVSLLTIPVVAQAKADVRQVNEFDPRQGCETLERSLDHVFAEAFNVAGATAIVVIHQGNNAFDNAVVHRKALSYRGFRGFPAERYTVLLTKRDGDIRVSLWVGQNGHEPAVAPAKLDTALSPGISRFRIIEETLGLVKIDRKDRYLGTGNASCLYFFGPWLIADLLKANPRFDAELRIKTTSLITYRKLVRLVKSEFLKSGISDRRLRFIYLGRERDQEGGGGGGKYATISAFLVKQIRK